MTDRTMDVEQAVLDRYSLAARGAEAALCCPVAYDRRYLEAIPQAVLDRDYGCGDPSLYVREGDQVLDLGSGGGKIAFIAAQIVGPRGRVVGIDMNVEMLALARGAVPEVARRIGFGNVEFRRGRIQDLALDLDQLDALLSARPIADSAALFAVEDQTARLRAEGPMVPDASVDIVVSNCVLNLVREQDRESLLREVYRVLRPGGRIALSDIVSDEPVPDEFRQDRELWSGCVSGAFHERELLERLGAVGFYGIALDKWEPAPFRTVMGIEFRSVTITARKGKEGPCFEGNQAVIYRGPWREVRDDDGHVLRRGERTAVCEKTYGILTQQPYAESVIAIPSRVEMVERRGFDCQRTAPRDPRETKGQEYAATTQGAACGAQGCC